MANYKVRSSRLGDGRYEFTYGRGDNKLAAVAWNNEVAGGWQVDGNGAASVNKNGPYRTKKDLKEAWAAWAEKVYDSDAAQSPGPTTAGQPSESTPTPSARKGPPPHKPSLRQKGPPPKQSRKGPPERPKPRPVEQGDAASPFDIRFRHPSDHENLDLRQQITPLGAVVHIVDALDKANLQHVVLDAIRRECKDLIAREAPDLNLENLHGSVSKQASASEEPKQRPQGLDREALNAALRRGADIDPTDIPF